MASKFMGLADYAVSTTPYGTESMQDHDDPQAAEAQRVLESVNARSLISDDLLARIRGVLDEIAALTRDAEQLRERVEAFYPEVEALDEEHLALIKTKFPKGLPDYPDADVVLPFDEMTGNDRVFRAFHDLLRVLHNAVPDYPNETRDDLMDT